MGSSLFSEKGSCAMKGLWKELAFARDDERLCWAFTVFIYSYKLKKKSKGGKILLTQIALAQLLHFSDICPARARQGSEYNKPSL